MNKIVGFLITPKEQKIFPDFFQRGLKTVHLTNPFYNIYLWGIGNILLCKCSDKYSLSFPLHDNLLDRNVLVNIKTDKITIENDWLGSIPVFFNNKQLIVSTLPINCLHEKNIHSEGLNNFFEFGYCVFGQTPFKNIKFMRFLSKLVIHDNRIEIVYKDDPVLDNKIFRKNSTVEKTFTLIKDYMTKADSKLNGDIILPLSGGYDSRLINYFVSDKSKIRSFTYGVSKRQSKSIEVLYARKVAEILGTKWKQIELKHSYKYIDDWFRLYGFSTHLHGMYHIEFYKKIVESIQSNNCSFLSGIVGDAWAGRIVYRPIEDYHHVINLGYTHGINIDLTYLKMRTDHLLKKNFFKEYKNYLIDDRIKIIFTIRLKIMLISYLTQIPEYLGFPVWTPFLNYEIAMAMLNLPESSRKNRQWQTDFFKRVGLNIEDMGINVNLSNTLDYNLTLNNQLDLINVDVMADFIEKERLLEINKRLCKIGIGKKIKNEILNLPKVSGLLKKVRITNDYLTSLLYEYFIIKAIEKSITY